MNAAHPPLIAALTAGRYRYEWSWLETIRDEPWKLAAAVSVLALVVIFTVTLHFRERRAVSPWIAGGLIALRGLAIAGVVVFLLGPQRRSAEEVTRQSQVVVLVDSSASMAMRNNLASKPGDAPTRAEAARSLLNGAGLLRDLAQTHRVSVAAAGSVGEAIVVGEPGSDPSPDSGPEEDKPALPDIFNATGAETRLGDAIDETLRAYAGEPLAGIVLLTDGQNNSGAQPDAAATRAADRGVRVVTVGFGPDRVGANVVVRELVAPARAYPDDEIELTALVDITGDPSGECSLSLFRRPADADESADVLLATRVAEEQDGGQTLSMSFKTTPEQAGRFVYTVRANPLPREVRKDDNHREAVVEVVDQTTTVLLWAGGPNRDFRFLRDQLKRDDSFVSDLLLQSAPPTASQDARAVLQAFPKTEEELNNYDVLVAMDPDWSQLSADQAELISDWISRRGAGLYFAPGPINTPKWFQRGPSDAIRTLLPVSLPERLTLLQPGAGTTPPARPSSVKPTRAGSDADFLWIAGGREASARAWRDFAGFYRVGETESLSPGATVFAEAVDSSSDDSRVLLAEQYFGAGRVFFSASNELWRLRAESPDYFNTLWTKLLRRLAQGRLLANAPGGSLVFERQRYLVGDAAVLRVMLPQSTEQLSVQAEVFPPDGDAFVVTLEPTQSGGEGFTGRFTTQREGAYQAEVSLGQANTLVARAEVLAPAAERDHPTRDEKLLAQIARAGGGWYYPTREAVMKGAGTAPPLVDALPSRTETRTVYGQHDREFAQRLAEGLLGVICGALLLEWLVRRMVSLA